MVSSVISVDSLVWNQISVALRRLSLYSSVLCSGFLPLEGCQMAPRWVATRRPASGHTLVRCWWEWWFSCSNMKSACMFFWWQDNSDQLFSRSCLARFILRNEMASPPVQPDQYKAVKWSTTANMENTQDRRTMPMHEAQPESMIHTYTWSTTWPLQDARWRGGWTTPPPPRSRNLHRHTAANDNDQATNTQQ
jgi:hypothetical protein